jgi:S1-C subfamily serine protease
MSTLAFRFLRIFLASASLSLACLRAEEPATPSLAPESVAAPATKPEESKSFKIENSVVHIFSTISRPEFTKPWAKASPQEISGSGVIIEGKRILTNAHVVLYAKDVQVQANQSGDKFNASVEYMNPYMDLALLKLEDESFFDTRPPVERANLLPSLKDSVLAYGYPTGGNALSITKGIVSRIEFAGYNYPMAGLRIQIDAAINPGNSGGPAIAGDRMIGLAFSHLAGAQNIGYIIPNEEIELFLKDIADGKMDGKPGLQIEFQSSENPALRSFLKLKPTDEGVIYADHTPDPELPFKTWDLITRIGETKIDNQGMIKIAGGNTVGFRYEIQHLAKDGLCPFTLVRDGKPMTVQVPVHSMPVDLFPNHMGEYPKYFICGPLVFCVADFHTLATIVSAKTNIAIALSITGNPLITRRDQDPAFPGEELVFIPSPFFPHKLTKGYGMPFGRVLESLNDTHVRNLRHLVEMLRDAKGDYLVFKMAGRGEQLVFPRKEFLASTEQILIDNNVREQGSADLMEVWRAAAK